MHIDDFVFAIGPDSGHGNERGVVSPKFGELFHILIEEMFGNTINDPYNACPLTFIFSKSNAWNDKSPSDKNP